MAPLTHRPLHWTFVAFELAPIAAFSWSGRFGLPIDQRFILGAGLAVACTAVLVLRRWAINPLFTAINLWLCLEAIALGAGIDRLARLSAQMQESALFATMLLAGLVCWAVLPRGLFSRRAGDVRRVRLGTLTLLGMIAAALVWSLAWRGHEQIAAVLPATVILLAQQLWPSARPA
ncbi:hypothetical protein [Palleronia abyssalis]|uniref:Uncharacterized protein n=1 Tax=Palleronia abyssalis TaxID=1501240 RepID=A0A2R8BUE6_9RHOB|nr:hypothetical protein [Palleronia abyssalis]SPJ23716.1 hypothetical protein PAA8504_01531 [Palleronia abyssalis]